MQADTARLDISIKNVQQKVNGLDTLTNLSFEATTKALNDSQYRKMYYFMRKYGNSREDFISTNRANVLLEKGDAFSLIKKQSISDSILTYQEAIRRMEGQYNNYILKRNETNEIGEKLFDWRLMQNIKDIGKVDIILQSNQKYPLMLNDKSLLLLYGTRNWISSGILNGYLTMLRSHKKSIVHLIEALKKEYHIGNE